MLCPALRAKMGDRWFYVATMTFGEIAAAVQPVPELPADATLKMWIQRKLRPERTGEIAEYLATQKQRFFNALVLGIYGGEPEWQPVAVKENLRIKDHELDERQANSFGMIHLSGAENIFAIDGQHRVEGIRAAVALNKKLAREEQTVIFIAHHETEAGRERTRRLFATLNGYARPISEREIVAISEDNAFAKSTRRLVEEYTGLGVHFVSLAPATDIKPNEKSCITTIVGLYRLTQFVSPSLLRRRMKKLKDGPSSQSEVDEIFEASSAYWDALKKHVPEIRKVCASNPKEELAANYRHADGGHLLFRPKGMEAFARASRILMDRGDTVDKAVAKLVKAPLDLTHPLWREVLWRPESKRMLWNWRLAMNLFLWWADEPAEKSSYSVAAEYKRITGGNLPKRE